ncbi:MAG: phosphoenolpyruvate hydrolase family protein [Bacillota bacterium]|nr:phosphoenolpyruvate hydrolase family protein [Bacillota bacterium]
MNREQIVKNLKAKIKVSGHIIGTVAGSGMTARFTSLGGADLFLALSAGKFRLMGRGSYMSYFCYCNSNDMVMNFGTQELLPLLDDKPIFFGLNASDPTISLYDYIRKIKESGFAGIVNFPTICLIDGQFGEALEEEGNTYDAEVEAIRFAHYLDMLTIAFVTTEEEAGKMVDAGADIICAHLGLTKGGYTGAKKYLSLEAACNLSSRIFKLCEDKRPDIIKMVYGGPLVTPEDVRYVFSKTSCEGYIGGSTFDRIPIEQVLLDTTASFKSYGTQDTDLIGKLFNGSLDRKDQVKFAQSYIEEHYMLPDLYLADIALFLGVSGSYLSTKFKRETGVSFTEYLVRFRMNKARELLRGPYSTLREVAERVGYTDYVQFSKMFKKYVGVTPSDFAKDNINTK